MKHLIALTLLAIVTFSCQSNYNRSNDVKDYTPSNANTIMRIGDASSFIQTLNTNGLAKATLSNHASILSKLNRFNFSNEIMVAIVDDDSYTITTKRDTSNHKLDSILKIKTTSPTTKDVRSFQLDDSTLYYSIANELYIISNKKALIHNIVASKPSTSNHLLNTLDDEKPLSVLYKSNHSFDDFLFNKDSIRFSQQSTLDIDIQNDLILFNGITQAQDSSLSLINVFKNTIPQENKAYQVAPYDSSSLLSLTFDDYDVFSKNLALYNKIENDSSYNFLSYVNEISLLKRHAEKALICTTNDAELVLEAIAPEGSVETFRDVAILEFGATAFFKQRLAPLITFENTAYIIVFGDFVIFSDSIDFLKSIVSNTQSNNTLKDSEAYLSVKAQLSDEASLLYYCSGNQLKQHLASTLSSNEPIGNFNTNAVQYIYDNDFAHINGAYMNYKKRPVSKSVTEAFSVTTDNEILSTPQTVKNHITKANDIIVQDVNNILYLISDSGSILWKKQLNGKILGTVEQIDSYKNGRLQLAFATKNRVYLIDRNGKDVGAFPLKFNDNITQPLSVFDYDNTKNYRLLVTQGKSLLMYDARGKAIKGFKYSNNSEIITSQPKHFRVARKDYIVFSKGQQLVILNRKGKVRVPVNQKIRFSDNEIYLYQNRFTTTNTLGELVQVNTKGELKTKPLGLVEDHNIVTTSKTLVTLTDNKLGIKSKTLDLDYGSYTDPSIFYLNDKIYVTVTDKQSKKIYLFDSQAKPIANFPVFGTSEAVLEKLDRSRDLELITTSDNNTIIVYKLN